MSAAQFTGSLTATRRDLSVQVCTMSRRNPGHCRQLRAGLSGSRQEQGKE
ncbi:hypothetical protein C4K34_3400 [Pseudomonas chlororaphis subsp. piscium]|nr:hypothetical protein C4K34_3400 [Pseudomonas chlororaphis subsp. piscium]AZC63783.1 hypothetical protein C4K33_3291 [Pseudomonas chlororaphis subsp. piscium]AZC70021.1 hypothetical protein C4K32_3359 [Pseudomonas chlororaphis subsp. piscium]AZC76270.1 hypothetical protein C4K31_3367 [Pseudomonas chlororaphis subsp. piscium]AZC82497.1 hypothetical protein C4K30_3383 [Pseudomonas chlororaphis subsp. piscium]